MMRRLLLGFLAGFLATIIFHQIALQLLHMAGMVPRAAWAMRPVPPFGVPAVISLSFWGGVWGAIMIPIIDRLRGGKYWLAALVFGAIAPTLVAWFVVSAGLWFARFGRAQRARPVRDVDRDLLPPTA